jgi:hypothetical protein
VQDRFMLEKYKTEESIWRWRWPIIGLAVIAVLLGIQILLVNKKPTAPTPAPDSRVYTKPGSLVSGEVVVPPADYYSNRIDVNRRAKVSGEFRTADLKSRVSVLVLKEDDFENWKLDHEYKALTQTGYVPGGKIHSVLEPGSYVLIIDNRRNADSRSVRADLILE